MNFIAEKIGSGISRGIFISSGSEVAVELAAAAGFDWVLLDMEHGLGDESKILSMIRCLDATGTAPIVRIPALREEYIKHVLDYGAAGIMCPMVRSVEDVHELLACMRYSPQGRRGLIAGSRASRYGEDFTTYFERANSELLCVVQIETEAALEKVDAIAAVDGVDVLFLGHSDMSLALGCHGDYGHDSMVTAEQNILRAALKHEKTAGMLLKHGMDEGSYVKRGFHFMAVGSDIRCLRAGYKKLATDTNIPENGGERRRQTGT